MATVYPVPGDVTRVGRRPVYHADMADTDQRVSDDIEALIAEEHRLLDAEAASHTGSERARLEQIRVELDRLWDLLRQRRARRAAGSDPDFASERDRATLDNDGT